MIIDDMWFVANVGDWRSILSANGGSTLYQLSKDHKPSDPSERDRVIDGGGNIYVSAIKQVNGASGISIQRTDKLIMKNDTIKASTENALNVIESGGEAYGPYRVLPGRLSVSRAIGDAHAKIKQLGGNPLVVIPNPDIKVFKILEWHDFIVMGSDGLYDKQSNSNIIQSIFKKGIEMYTQQTQDINLIANSWAELWIQEAIDQKSLDNISWNVIFFDNFLNFLNGRPIKNSSMDNNVKTGIKRENSINNKLNNLPSHLNYDLVDADIDTTHSSKAIERICESLKKQKILEEGEQVINTFSTQPFGNSHSKSSSIAMMQNSGLSK